MSCETRREKRCNACPNKYVHDYLAVNEGITIKSSTADSYRGHLAQFDRFLNENGLSIIESEREAVVQFIETCVRQGNRQSTLSAKLTAIKNLYRHIRLRMEEEQLSLDPIELATIGLEKYNTPPPIEREALSRKEIRKLFDSMDSYRNRLLVVVGVETALRNSDLREIRLNDVKLDELRIHVPDPKNSKPYDVPISDELRFEIEQWKKYHRGAFATASQSDYLFPGKSGPKLSTNGGLNELVKKAASRAGIQGTIGKSELTQEHQEALGTKKKTRQWHRVTVHTLRHSCLTLMKEAEIPLSYRQLVANHSSPATTMGYTHGSTDIYQVIRDNFRPPR